MPADLSRLLLPRKTQIHALEMTALIAALHANLRHLHRRRLLAFVDNQSALGALKKEGQLFGKGPGSSGGSRSHSGRSVQLRALPSLGTIVAQSRRSSIQGAPRRVRLCDEVFSPIVTHSYDSEVSGIGRVTQNKGPHPLTPALV